MHFHKSVISCLQRCDSLEIWASAEIMAPAAVQKVKNRNDRKLIVLTYLLNEYLNLKKTLISSLIWLCFFFVRSI